MESHYPILEYDESRDAAINPGAFSQPLGRLPSLAVLCFFKDVLDNLRSLGKLQIIGYLRSEIGQNPVYSLLYDKTLIAIVHPGVGSPLVVAFLEELIAHGVIKIIACGSAGVLDRSISEEHLILPLCALRDEGTSYHYLAPSREVFANPIVVDKIKYVLCRNKVAFITGKTWTTDAIFRETFSKIMQRKREGCICVEMEAAALFAVAEYRKVLLGQILYGSDDFNLNKWNRRYFSTGAYLIREKLFWQAVEIAVNM